MPDEKVHTTDPTTGIEAEVHSGDFVLIGAGIRSNSGGLKIAPYADGTGAVQIVQSDESTVVASFDTTNKRFYVGGTGAPTAVLHLAASSGAAGTAPIKLTSGTALGTPEDGALEYDGSHLSFTVGSSRYQLDQQGGGSLPASTHSGQVLLGNGSGGWAVNDDLALSGAGNRTISVGHPDTAGIGKNLSVSAGSGVHRATTLDVTMEGADVFSTTPIVVATTAGFPTTGVILVTTDSGVISVTYTGITGTSFTGCSTASHGTMHSGGAIDSPDVNGGALYVTAGQGYGSTGVYGQVWAGSDGTSDTSSLVRLGFRSDYAGNNWGAIDIPSSTSSPSALIFADSVTFRSSTTGGGGDTRIIKVAQPSIGSYGDNLCLYAGQAPANASTTLAASMDTLTLPQATIEVATITGFSSQGKIRVTTSAGVQTVTYTGRSPGPPRFTGCSGGTGTMSTGGAVNSAFEGGTVKIDAGAKDAVGTQSGFIMIGSQYGSGAQQTEAVIVGKLGGGGAPLVVMNSSTSAYYPRPAILLGWNGLWHDAGTPEGNTQLALGATSDTYYPLYVNYGGSPTYPPGIQFSKSSGYWELQTASLAWRNVWNLPNNGTFTFQIENAAVSANVTAANLTALTGSGSTSLHTHPETAGGTGQITFATGDILYASSTNTLSKLPVGSPGNVLTVSGGAPAWSAGASGQSSGLRYWFSHPITTDSAPVTGPISLVFSAAAKTITRSDGGSFITDGWAARQKCNITGTVSNNVTVEVRSVAATVLTLCVTSILVNETHSATLTIDSEGFQRVPSGLTEQVETLTGITNADPNGIPIDNYITDIGVPGTLFIPAGLWRFVAAFSATNSTCTAGYEVSKKSEDGKTSTVLFTTSTTPGLTTTLTVYEIDYTVSSPIALSAGDRIVVRVLGYNSSITARNITWVYDGTARAAYVDTTFSASLGPASAITSMVSGVQYADAGAGMDKIVGMTPTFNPSSLGSGIQTNTFHAVGSVPTGSTGKVTLYDATNHNTLYSSGTLSPGAFDLSSAVTLASGSQQLEVWIQTIVNTGGNLNCFQASIVTSFS